MIKLKFEGFFLVGFFLLAFFLLGGQLIVASVGALLMLLAFVIDFQKKRFLTRDIYMLGYAFSTVLVVVSFVHNNLIALVIGTLSMLFALFMFTLHKRKLLHEKHKRILKKHPQHKFVPSRAPKVSIFLDANMWSLITVVALLFAGFLHNLFLLILGLLLSGLSIVLQTIKIRALKRKWKELAHKRVLDMKNDLKTRHNRYETDFDKLIRLIQKYQSLRISEVAKVFNIPLDKAEEWGKILEEHGFLHIHFPAIGEAELRWK